MTPCRPYGENGERAFTPHPERHDCKSVDRLRSSHWRSGFTFIELLFVIIIIGVLASLALPQYSRTLEKMRLAEAMQILETLRNAQYAYKTEFGSYTATLGDLDVTIPVSNNFNAPTVQNDAADLAQVARTGLSYEVHIKESGLIVCVNIGIPGICVQIGCKDIDAGVEDPCN